MPGTEYRILDGVRRAKAAQLAGHSTIRAHVFDRNGVIIATRDIPIDSLRSPKDSIQRITRADEIRWRRAEQGANRSPLPFPPILVQTGSQGIRIDDVRFDFGGNP